MLNDEEASEASDLWALGCIVFQMLSGTPPFRADSEYLTFKRIEELDFSFPDGFDGAAQDLVRELLQPEPVRRLGVGGEAGGYAMLKAHPFFVTGEPQLDFSLIHTLPPPPLVPPPPAPSISGDTLYNDQLASANRRLSPADRRTLMEQQARTRCAQLMNVEQLELIVLAAPVYKQRHLSVRRRQLVLSECVDGSCRLIYLDPETNEIKGVIPWSAEVHAELLPRGQFRVHTPGRTYYLTDCSGDERMAERWVRIISQLLSRDIRMSAPDGPP